MMKNTLRLLATSILVLSFVGQATARDNDDYGETRFNSLPVKGMVSKTIWVGSWWAYGTDGSAFRLRDPKANNFSGWEEYAKNFDRWNDKSDAVLSPAEKYDKWEGRTDKIEYDNLVAKAKLVDGLRTDVKSLIDERRTLIRTLNKWIGDNDGKDWRETDDGKRYLEVDKELKEKQASPDEVKITIDTVTEYEIINHGTAQFGVEGWFGHCNAWAAAAIMEPEPRQSTTVDGIEFTAGDVKAYLTEMWMELRSSFHGSRNDWHDTEDARKEINFQDVTPAGFHIFFADQIGNRDASFVIDRYTGSQVWNQPTKSYRVTDIEKLYEGEGADAKPVEREVVYTKYGAGNPKLDERGKQEVYPILLTTTIHWMTDGLPHETLTVESISNEIDDATYASSWRIGDMWDHQVEIRTLTYELWLDKPMDDPEARIVGDGKWEHGSATGYEHLHPDFMWQPQANVNDSRRDYENELYDYDKISDELVPGTLEAKDNDDVKPTEFVATGGPVDIPDADPSTPATLTVDVDSDAEVAVLSIDVDITHTYIGDLEISLTAPGAPDRPVILKPFGDGGSSDDVKKTFDVKDFKGLAAKGTWTLTAKDQWREDTGAINGFTLHIK